MRIKSLTVIREPQQNVHRGERAPFFERVDSGEKRRLRTPGASPARTTIGRSATALRKLVYQLSKRALPPTTLRDCLMTTE